MEKYKICPSCKTKNIPTAWECISCEADLTGIKITDEETEKMLKANADAANEVATELVRVCDCGAKNPPNARKCQTCGEDISDITPTAEVATEQQSTTYVLSSLDGKYAHKIETNEEIIGRESGMQEYLGAKNFVSRMHAKITIEVENLYVEDLNSTNSTYVNNKKITQRTKLVDGDELALGGTNINGKCQNEAAYFLVRIGQCM